LDSSSRHLVPGFGVSIGEAVQASCSAYPYFNIKTVTTAAGDKVQLIDGGFCANSPALYAIADAVIAMKVNPANLRVVSVGVERAFAERMWAGPYLSKPS
jgi:patatin-like phospholipase/acyl hydrolase